MLFRSVGGGAQRGAVEFVEAGLGQLQFGLNAGGGEWAGAERGQQMANERSGQAMDQWEFFIGSRVGEAEGFCALKLTPAELGPAGRLSGFRRRSGCVPAEARSSAEAPAMMRPGG